jgi:YegS/Rv2252/BmrU family lipid kinase
VHIALVLNPKAGSAPDAGELTGRLRELGAERVDVTPIDEAEAALATSPDRLVVAGGDGSIGRAAAIAAARRIPLAVIPAGTANDFARAAGIPDDLDDACRAAVHGTPVAYDLAWIGDRPFVNVANAGLAVHAAHEARRWKRVLGALAYPVGAFRAGISAHPIRCDVTADGEPLFGGAAWQVLIGNSNAFGGGADMRMGDARDARLAVAVVRSGSRLALARHAHALRFGDLRRQPDVVRGRAREVRVDAPAGLAFNVDGEIVETGTAVTARIEPGAFLLAVPPPPD